MTSSRDARSGPIHGVEYATSDLIDQITTSVRASPRELIHTF